MSEAAERVREWAADASEDVRQLWQAVYEAIARLDDGERAAEDLEDAAQFRAQTMIERAEEYLEQAQDLLEAAADQLEDLANDDLGEDG